MKKYFIFAAMAAFALVSCNKNDITTDDAGNNGGNVVKGIVLNEIDGQNKFIELYNTTDAVVSLEGIQLVKYDSSKEGGKTVTWTGAAGMTLAAKGFIYIESTDLADPAEGGDGNYVYQSENHIFKGGLSPKKNMKIELLDAKDGVLDTFTRGEEGSGWNQFKGYNNNKEASFCRVPDGTGEWAYAAPTKGTANGEKTGDIEQTPEL